MKHLRIECDDIVLFDGEVAAISWSDTGDQVTVTGKSQAGSSGGGNKLVQMLSEAVKKQTEQTETLVEERRAELAAEKKAYRQARLTSDSSVITVGD